VSAAPDRLEDPAPVRRHEDAFAAQLDAARLADAGIPVRVIEPRGPSGFGGSGLAVVMVPADRVPEAVEVLEASAAIDAEAADAAADTGATADTGAPADAAAPADTAAPDDPPFSAAPVPPLARLGLWLAAAAVLLGILGALVTLFTEP
jgi:hypothetical protein